MKAPKATPFDALIVIASKGRASICAKGAGKLFPSALICIGEDERKIYKGFFPDGRVLVHPSNVTGIGPVRQWILDNVKNDIIIFVDDDIKHFYSQTGLRKRRFECPETAEAVLLKTALAAKDSGAKLFGFSQSARQLNYNGTKPIAHCGWVGGIVGIIGRTLSYDTKLLLRADVDLCLQSLVKNRFIWIDNRFCFVHKRFNDTGGNAINRSAERHEAEIAYLKKKWKGHLQIKQTKSQTILQIKVERYQHH